MKLFAILLSSLAVMATAKNVDREKFKVPDGAVMFGISGHRSPTHPNPRVHEKYAKFNEERLLAKRKDKDGTLQVKVNNEDYSYYSTEIQVGSKKEKINVLMDTGSSDLWAIASNNPYCTTDPRKYLTNPSYTQCNDGTFDYEKSKSFSKNKTADFAILYADATGATGFWGTDNVKFGDITLKDCSIGVGDKANTSQGVLGLGYTLIESTNRGSKGYQYLNVPKLLVSQGHTKSVAYSLWLNDPKSKSGNILFGGVDHKKYSGDLVKLPIAQTIRTIDRPVEMAVMLSKIGMKNNANDDKVQNVFKANIPALLDSGTTLSYLPQQVIRQIGRAIGAEYYSDLQTYVMPCDPGDATIEFDFNGAVIDVKMKEMTIPLTDQRGDTATFEDGTEACALAMGPSEEQVILGDSFLRSAYVVYDLERDEIAMANAKFNEDDSYIETIDTEIPRAKKAAGYDNTAFNARATVNPATLDMDAGTVGTLTQSVETGITAIPPITNSLASVHASSATAEATTTKKKGDAARPAAIASGSLLVCMLAGCLSLLF